MTIHLDLKQIRAIVECTEFDFDPQGRMVLFVGHAHSGHSLIGALLDAHPDVALANEVNVAKLAQEHQLDADAIEKILYHAYTTNTQGWKNSAYLYDLKGAAQGISIQPTVLGDKKAGGTTRILHNHPQLLNRLMALYGPRLRFIYVARNPVDVVAAYSHYMQQPPSMFHVNRYNENLKTVLRVKSGVPADQFIQINQDQFVQQPEHELLRLFQFLNVSTESHAKSIQQWVSVVRSDIPGKSQSIHINDQLRAAIED